jgi:hypothetical protein
LMVGLRAIAVRAATPITAIAAGFGEFCVEGANSRAFRMYGDRRG